MLKLGRKPRTFDPRVKHLKAMVPHLPVAPLAADWTRGITQFGPMLNDQLGDCTCAAVYHARQIWTANNGGEITEPDADVLKLYELACGYVPGDPSTDQGGVEQRVLTYLLNQGMPLSNGAVDKILGFVEINHKIQNEVKVTINEFGLTYIGFNVPDSIFDENNRPFPVWDYTPGASSIGGHAVVLPAYGPNGLSVISWGQVYKMTWEFFEAYCDEAYAIIDKSWINATGQTPLGLTLAQIENLMSELRG